MNPQEGAGGRKRKTAHAMLYQFFWGIVDFQNKEYPERIWITYLEFGPFEDSGK
jgi:hypothetical protein